MKLNIDCPINSLSMGQISYGVLNELFNQNVDVFLLPKNRSVDLAAYDRCSESFKSKLKYSIEENAKTYSPEDPGLVIWHLYDSYLKPSKRNYLLTFHELDSITDQEKAALNSFEKIFVTSSFTKTVFEENGVDKPVIHIPIGIDNTHSYKINKQYYPDNVVSWLIAGKFEKRKNTKKAIQGWLSLYANNPDHRLHLLINNPFYNPESMNAVFSDIFQGKPLPNNVLIMNHLPLNSQVNDLLNASDAIIDMSGGEALSLPSLNALALGKHGVIHSCTAMLDWAALGGATTVKPNGVEPAYDGVFFHQGLPYNQGNIFTWSTAEYLNALQECNSKVRANKLNQNGLLLNNIYSYKQGVSLMLEAIS